MKNILCKIAFASLSCLSFCSIQAATNADSPVGYWAITQPAGDIIVKVDADNNSLVGKIVKIPGKDQNAPCEKCKGQYHMKSIIGTKILWGFTHQDHDWVGGKLYGVRIDKTFNADLKVLEGGQQMRVTAHATFGNHEEVWSRVNY